MYHNYEYDAMGRLIRKSASGRTLLAMSYDLNGNLVGQEDISGKVLQYQYNDLGILQYVNDNGNKVAERTYYPDGTIKSFKSGSLYTEYAYDADRNLTSLKTVLGGEVLADNRYSYDRNGNRTERQQPGETTRYTYDSVNQLTRIEYPTYTEQLYYDKAGNTLRPGGQHDPGDLLPGRPDPGEGGGVRFIRFVTTGTTAAFGSATVPGPAWNIGTTETTT